MSESNKKEEFEARQAELRAAQNLPEGAVPDQRPIASNTDPDPHSRVYKELQEAGDPRANNEAHDFEAYERANSESQAKKAAKQSKSVVRLYPGARCYIDREGHPDHGRAVAVNRVTDWASPEDAVKASLGDANSRFAKPAEYEVSSRDGRAELLLVKAEHLRPVAEQADWGRTSIY